MAALCVADQAKLQQWVFDPPVYENSPTGDQISGHHVDFFTQYSIQLVPGSCEALMGDATRLMARISDVAANPTLQPNRWCEELSSDYNILVTTHRAYVERLAVLQSYDASLVDAIKRLKDARIEPGADADSSVKEAYQSATESIARLEYTRRQTTDALTNLGKLSEDTHMTNMRMLCEIVVTNKCKPLGWGQAGTTTGAMLMQSLPKELLTTHEAEKAAKASHAEKV